MMPPAIGPSAKVIALVVVMAVVTLLGGYAAYHIWSNGRASQAAKDQPVITKALTGEAATKVKADLTLGVGRAVSGGADREARISKITNEAINNVTIAPSPKENAHRGDASVSGAPPGAYIAGLQRMRDSYPPN